jgi:hypothetical protein
MLPGTNLARQGQPRRLQKLKTPAVRTLEVYPEITALNNLRKTGLYFGAVSQVNVFIGGGVISRPVYDSFNAGVPCFGEAGPYGGHHPGDFIINFVITRFPRFGAGFIVRRHTVYFIPGKLFQIRFTSYQFPTMEKGVEE